MAELVNVANMTIIVDDSEEEEEEESSTGQNEGLYLVCAAKTVVKAILDFY